MCEFDRGNGLLHAVDYFLCLVVLALLTAAMLPCTAYMAITKSLRRKK